MRLRQHATYVRLTTMADLLDAGAHIGLVEDLEQLAGERFTAFRDLSRPRLPEQPLGERRDELLGAHTGAGFHQSTRWILTAPGAAALRSFELNAMLHPYTGVYVVHIDARVAADWADANADALAELCRAWVATTTPLTLHAHDVDDHAIQNCESTQMLRLGYGVDAEALGDRPGRERNRGHFRFAIDWVSYFGPETVALLERDADDRVWSTPPEPLADGWWFRLYDRPGDANESTNRERQRTVRAEIGFDALVQKDRRVWGYWQRKQ